MTAGAATTIRFGEIAARAFNAPLLLHPAKARIIAEVLLGRIGGEGYVAAPTPQASRFVGSRKGRMFYSMEGSTAIVGVHGTLVNRGAWLGAASGMTSYEGLTAQLRDAASDKAVERVVLDIDSPGGEAAGMMALADQVRALRAVKPVIAVVNDMAASAGYGLAAQASRVVVSPTSLTGSIGVVFLHLDYSGQLQQRGIAATFIYAGRHKVDGHSLGPLPESVKADLQAEVAALYEMFVAKVAQGRRRLTADAIRATEARTFTGVDGIKAGLADDVGTIFDVLADPSRHGSRTVPAGFRRSATAPALRGFQRSRQQESTR